MIEHRTGNLLKSEAEALVNTVNTVGVMGKGVALQFRKAFPENFKAYKRACAAGQVRPGHMFVFQTQQLSGPRLIINFPTKRHWRGKARLPDIEAGLADLVRVMRDFEVRSVAIPPLGCGNGGLRWDDVRPMIEAAFSGLQDTRALIYEPSGAPTEVSQQVATRRPRMTRGRAMVLAALGTYRSDPASTLTALVAQKLAYLLQETGEPLKLEFTKGKYGPYAEVLNHVLQGLEGHYIIGVGDRTTAGDIRFTDGSLNEALAFIGDDRDAAARVGRVGKLIEGFESPFGLELLTTVHWAAANDGARSASEALDVVSNWNERKREIFGKRQVDIAWGRLEREGWIDSTIAG